MPPFEWNGDSITYAVCFRFVDVRVFPGPSCLQTSSARMQAECRQNISTHASGAALPPLALPPLALLPLALPPVASLPLALPPLAFPPVRVTPNPFGHVSVKFERVPVNLLGRAPLIV